MDMFEKVRKVICEFKDFKEEEVTMDTEFEELGLDSLDMVELVMQIEEEMGITVEMNEDLKTVRDVVNELEGKNE